MHETDSILLLVMLFFRYEKLLKQTRLENDDEIRKRQDEIVALKTTIKNQGTVLIIFYETIEQL